MIINDLDDYYIVFDTKNRNTELDALKNIYKVLSMIKTIRTTRTAVIFSVIVIQIYLFLLLCIRF